MHSNSMLLGLAVAPLPGYGVQGKVPARFAHLVELKKSVRDKAWTHWTAAPGVATHNSGKNKSSSKNKIRLTAGTATTAGGATNASGTTVDLPSAQTSSLPTTQGSDTTSNAAVHHSSIHAGDTIAPDTAQSTEMDVDAQFIVTETVNIPNNKQKTQFALTRPAKKLCRRQPFEKGYFLTDTYIED